MNFPEVAEYPDTGAWLALTGPMDGKVFPAGAHAPVISLAAPILRHSGVYLLRQSRLENYDHWLASNPSTVRTRANHRRWVVELVEDRAPAQTPRRRSAGGRGTPPAPARRRRARGVRDVAWRPPPDRDAPSRRGRLRRAEGADARPAAHRSPRDSAHRCRSVRLRRARSIAGPAPRWVRSLRAAGCSGRDPARRRARGCSCAQTMNDRRLGPGLDVVLASAHLPDHGGMPRSHVAHASEDGNFCVRRSTLSRCWARTRRNS
jgi:hypothetical protein